MECLIFGLFPFQINSFCILFSLLIISIGTIVTRERCMILDIAKVLEMIIFPSTVKFRILHNFSTFSIFQTCLIKFPSLSSFYYKKNVFLKFLLFFGLSQYNQYHRVSVIPISGYPFHLNLNLIGYQSSAKGRGFVNFIIQHSLVLFFF